MKIKEIINKILYMITLILLFSMAYYITNIFLRILLVMVASVAANFILELFNYYIFKSYNLYVLIKELKDESDSRQKLANIISLFFIPIFQTIIVIVLSIFVHA